MEFDPNLRRPEDGTPPAEQPAEQPASSAPEQPASSQEEPSPAVYVGSEEGPGANAQPSGNPAYFDFGAPPPPRAPLQNDLPRTANTLAIVSFVCSLIGMLCCCGLLGIFLGVAGVACAIIDRVRRGHWNGFAIAGLIIGIIAVALSVVMMIISSILNAMIEDMINEGLLDPEFVDPEGNPVILAFRRFFGR